MITISRSHVEQMIKQAQQHYPIECCGIVAGMADEDFMEITQIYPMTNVDQSPEHFSLDPGEQFEVYYAIRDKGLQMLGNYHSHPASPARPSQEDLRLAYNPNDIYIIISLMQEVPVLKAFRIQNGNYQDIPLLISD